MKKAMLALCLLTQSGVTAGQEFPKVTEEGKKATKELLDACEKAGAYSGPHCLTRLRLRPTRCKQEGSGRAEAGYA
jgi:hypothetical protein